MTLLKENVRDFQREKKKEELKRKVKEKAIKAARWIDDNKETIIIVTPIAIALLKGGNGIIIKLLRARNLRKEQLLKDLYIYDPSLHMYHKLKKPLTSNQAVVISERRTSGEKLATILHEMNLLER